MTDLEMMKNPDSWPRWPFLPLKRGNPLGGKGDVGVLWAAEGYLTTVFMVNLYLFNTEHPEKMPQSKYPSHEAIVADGWVVD